MTSRQAVTLWWFTSVAGALATASPLLPWFDVLRTTPFDTAARDVGLLFDRLFTGASDAYTLPASSLFQSVLWQLLLWRCLMLVPTALAMETVARPTGAPQSGQWTAARGSTRTFVRLPQFIALTLTLQAVVWTVGGFGINAAVSRLTASEATLLDLTLGATLLGASLLLFACGLSVLDAARLFLFRRSRGPSSAGALSALVDAAELLRHRGWRLVASVVGCWCLGAAASVVLSGASLWLAASWPSSFANAVTWAVAQVGVLVALVCRILGWRRVWRWVNN